VKFNIPSTMKTQTSRRSHGFTLVELLVVIAIIAVLAGAGFAAGNAAIQKAKRTTAQATCVSLESAVNNFFTEYGSMPLDNLTADRTVDTTDLTLIRTLLGQEVGASALNPRAIRFLQVREGKANKNGLIYGASGRDITGFFDPWGGPYFIALDGDYDERVTVTPVNGAAGGSNRVLNGRRSAAWSNGADAGRSGTGGTAADNVITW
jgi:prepilin-type N-terminal cleavage/methylation domain-containing protein